MLRIAGLGIAAVTLLLIVLFALPSSPPAPKTPGSDEGPEALARLAVEALTAGTFEALESSVTTDVDLAWAFETYARGRHGEAQGTVDPLAAVGGAAAYAERLLRDAAATFKDARAEAQFTWEDVRLESWRTLERASMPGGVPLLDVVLRVENANGARHFVLADCFRSPRGWVTNAGVAYLGGPDSPASSWVGQRIARDVRRLTAAIVAYRTRSRHLPATLEDLLGPGEEGEAPLLYTLPQDPWGHAYQYKRLGDGFDTWSVGPDGLPDTDDDLGSGS